MADRPELTHVAASGEAHMVDVSAKQATRRAAVAEAWVDVGGEIARLLRETGSVSKGQALKTARLAGIMAAKRTPELIPLCHPLPIDRIDVSATLDGTRVHIVARVASESKTGVEMEALTAAAVAALTVYDMCKSAGKGIEIQSVRLVEKSGGKSGHWVREGDDCGND